MSSVEPSAAAPLPWGYIATSFVQAYYNALAASAETLYNFYDEQASAVRTVLRVNEADKSEEVPEWSSNELLTGQMAIHTVSQQIGECRVQVDTVDSVPSLDNGVLIQVTGVMHLLRDKQPTLRSFAQSFLLVSTAESSYAIRNDILRFLPYHEPAAAQQSQAPAAAAPQTATADASTETTGLKSPLQQAARAPTPAPAPAPLEKQQSPEPARSNIKSPQAAPAASPASPKPTAAAPVTESATAKESKSVDEKPAPQQPASQPPAAAPEQQPKEVEEVKQPEPAAPAQPAQQQQAKKSRAVAPAKPPSWAALLSKDSKAADAAATNEDASADEPAAAENQPTGKQESGKPAQSPTAAAGRSDSSQRRDSRIDRKDDLKVGQSKFTTGYRPTGFFGKPTLEQVQASVVINAVPDDITHGQLRDVVEREIAPVRNLHQPQGKKFIVVYFHSKPETEKALAQSTVVVNNHTLKLTVNTYRPSLGGGGGGGNFPDRRREQAAPEQSRRAFANEPDAEGFVTRESKKSSGGSGRGALRGGLSFGGSGRGGRGGFQAKGTAKTNGVAHESA